MRGFKMWLKRISPKSADWTLRAFFCLIVGVLFGGALGFAGPNDPASFDEELAEMQTSLASTRNKVMLLKEAALGGTIGACRGLILHKNEMGALVELQSARYILDGKTIVDRNNEDGELDKHLEAPLFEGALPPGEHEVKLSLAYRGRTLGLITYLEGYRFKVESRCRFEAVEGRLNRLTVVHHTVGDVTKETQDSFKVRCDFDVLDLSGKPVDLMIRGGRDRSKKSGS